MYYMYFRYSVGTTHRGIWIRSIIYIVRKTLMKYWLHVLIINSFSHSYVSISFLNKNKRIYLISEK